MSQVDSHSRLQVLLPILFIFLFCDKKHILLLLPRLFVQMNKAVSYRLDRQASHAAAGNTEWTERQCRHTLATARQPLKQAVC